MTAPNDGVIQDRLFELMLLGALVFLLGKVVWVFPVTVLLIVPLAVLFFFGPKILRGNKDDN